MKKLMMLSFVALAFSAAPALADHHGGDKGKMFEKKDANGDGVISKDEFMAAQEEKFNKMDADGNGEISKDEAKEARAKMHDKMKEKRETRRENRAEKKEETAAE